MRYPYDRFLTFLVSRKVEPNPALRKYGLPDIDRLWIMDCRKRIRETAPESVIIHIDSDSHEVLVQDGFLRWAETEGIRQLWEVQPEFGGNPIPDDLNTAFCLFMNRFSRSVMGLLLLAKCENDDIIKIVNERIDLGIDAQVIDLYRSLFWDVGHMPSKLWPTFTRTLNTKEEQHLVTIGYNEQPGLDTIRQVLELEPAAVTESEALTHLIETAHERYKMALKQANPENGDAFKWANVLLKAVAASSTRLKVDGGSSGEPVDLSGLFAVKVTKSHHISLSELQGQTSSVEGPKARGS